MDKKQKWLLDAFGVDCNALWVICQLVCQIVYGHKPIKINNNTTGKSTKNAKFSSVSEPIQTGTLFLQIYDIVQKQMLVLIDQFSDMWWFVARAPHAMRVSVNITIYNGLNIFSLTMSCAQLAVKARIIVYFVRRSESASVSTVQDFKLRT